MIAISSLLAMPRYPAQLTCMRVLDTTAPRSGLAWKHSIDVGAGVIGM